jgi:hypothetical protein
VTHERGPAISRYCANHIPIPPASLPSR